MKRASGVAEAVDVMHAALPEDWEAAPGVRREALAKLREVAVSLVEAAHALVGGSALQVERASQIARRAHAVATGHSADLRACMAVVESVELAAWALEYHPGSVHGIHRSATFLAAVEAWRRSEQARGGRGKRKWPAVCAAVAEATGWRPTPQSLPSQWARWRARRKPLTSKINGFESPR